VDFSAHICYHYITEDEKCPNDRIRGSLYALGVPILQGAGSTITGVLGLAFAPSYLFVTFFKMIFLVIVLGALHGLVLLPVLLSLFGASDCGSSHSKSSSKSTRSSGISTPTTISCGNMNQSPCYTVNLGFVTSNRAESFATENFVRGHSEIVPVSNLHHRHQDYKIWMPDTTKAAMMTDMESSYTVTEEISAVSSSSSSSTTPRMQMPDAEKNSEDRMKRTRHKGGHGSGCYRKDKKWRNFTGNSHPSNSSCPCNYHGNYFGDLSVATCSKKTLFRSRSQIPFSPNRSDSSELRFSNHADIQFVPNGDMWKPPSPNQLPNGSQPEMLAGHHPYSGKQQLRKYHSVPYHSFINDDSCSSEESFNERTRKRRHELLLLQLEQQQQQLQHQFSEHKMEC